MPRNSWLYKYYKLKKKLILLIVLQLCTTLVWAQKTYYSQSLYWLRYQNQLFFKPNLWWTNEFDNRKFFDPNVENQFIMHSRLHRKVNRWDFGGGITYSIGYAAIPENGYKKGRHEIRPTIEASYELPVRNFFIQQRLRIDNRFLQSDLDQSLWEESEHVVRFRYRLQARFVLKKNADNIQTIGLRIADEIMVNNKKNFYDQNRFYVTGEFYLTRAFSFELGYIYIDQQAYGREEYYARNVARFSLLHKIYLKKK
jgi:hypothetical protein